MASKALHICLSIVRWSPVVFITAIIVWSYYAYVIQMCIFTITNVPEKVIYLVLYHPLLFMFCWAYWKTTFVELGKVPKEFFLSSIDLEQFDRAENDGLQREILARAARNLPLQCRTNSGAVRYCEKCKCIKPDRAHHCSVCGICVLKMDHHCPWVNSCVCFFNYKFFVLFLGYALLYCLFVAATSLQYFIKFWSGIGGTNTDMAKLHIVFLFFAAIMFAISVLSLCGFHSFLVCSNRSTIESFRAPVFTSGPDKDGFSLGRTSNFIEIFGEDKRYWFLPIFTSQGDGVSYPTRVTPTQSNYHSMETTEQSPTEPSYGDGVTFPIRTVDEDYDSLLGQRQRWMEEGGDLDTADAYSNQVATQKNSVFAQSEDE